MKQKKAASLGIKTELITLPETVTENYLINKIKELNSIFDGIIVQLPLPKNLQTAPILNAIDPEKDVDGLTVTNLGKTVSGDERMAPATPKGVIALLEKYDIPVKGKKVVIINHSNLIGKPLSAMFLKRGATVTVCHEFTENLNQYTRVADILVSAVGIADIIKEDMVKEDAVVIDVGISKKNDIIAGDVHQDVAKKVSFLAPVPGSVGPMTIAILFENLVAKKIDVLNSRVMS